MRAASIFVLLAASPATADDLTVEQIAEKLKPSVVVVTVRGRDGKRGLGTGFVVAADGLIATNLHVIGEAGRSPSNWPTASARGHRRPRLRPRRRPRRPPHRREGRLTPLELGDSALKDGQAVVALGNPHGLKYSVVAGRRVGAARRSTAGSMIQLAIPVEPGNSGGPVLDMDGRVVGIVPSSRW